MENLTEVLAYIFLGLMLVTLIDTVGAISSRKLNFNYAYLTPLSFMVYTLIGYLISKAYNLNTALLSTCLIGIYDGTLGWKYALALKAKIVLTKDQVEKMTLWSRIIAMVAIALVFGYLGNCIALQLR